MTARDVLLAWAESGGFAAVHGGGASNEAIVDDLLAFLRREGQVIVPREPTTAMIKTGENTPVGHSWGKGAEFIVDPETIWQCMIAEADK